MNENEEFEFQLALEREQKPVTGSSVSPRSSPETLSGKQRAIDIAQGLGVGAMKGLVTGGTHLVDTALFPAHVLSNTLTGSAPQTQAWYDRSKATRDWWRREAETRPLSGVGEFASTLVGGAPLVKPGVKVAEAFLPRAIEETKRRTLGRGMLAGSVTGGATGALFGDNPVEEGVAGAVFGGVAPWVGNKIFGGTHAKSKAAQELLDEGVPMTIGTAAPKGGTGTLTVGAEQGARFLPFAGQAVENRQQESARAWRDRVLKEADLPGREVGAAAAGKENITDLLTAQRGELDKQLKDILNSSAFVNDVDLKKAFSGILKDPNRTFTPKEVDLITNTYNKLLGGRRAVPGVKGGGAWTGESLDLQRQELVRQGRKLLESDNAYQREVGQAYIDLAGEVHSLMMRQNPSVATRLGQLSQPRQALDVLEDVTSKTSNLGGFTPQQLITSARGQHPGIERLGRLGGEVYGNVNTGPRASGIDFRNVVQGAAALGHLFEPTTATPTIIAGALYRPSIQRAMLGEQPWQKSVVEYLKSKGLGDVIGVQ